GSLFKRLLASLSEERAACNRFFMASLARPMPYTGTTDRIVPDKAPDDQARLFEITSKGFLLRLGVAGPGSGGCRISSCRAALCRRHAPSGWTRRAAIVGLIGSRVITSSARKT